MEQRSAIEIKKKQVWIHRIMMSKITCTISPWDHGNLDDSLNHVHTHCRTGTDHHKIMVNLMILLIMFMPSAEPKLLQKKKLCKLTDSGLELKRYTHFNAFMYSPTILLRSVLSAHIRVCKSMPWQKELPVDVTKTVLQLLSFCSSRSTLVNSRKI